MMLFEPRKKVGENEYVEFFIDWRTEGVERELHEMDSKGIIFTGYKAYFIKSKDGACQDQYVIFDRDRKPVITFGDEWEASLMVKILRMNMEEQLELIKMAETREVPRVV